MSKMKNMPSKPAPKESTSKTLADPKREAFSPSCGGDTWSVSGYAKTSDKTLAK